MNYVLLDIGTSFIKGALFEADTLTLRHVVKMPSEPFLEPAHPYRRESNIDGFLMAVQKIIDAAAGHTTPCGIFISSQMHSFVLTDLKGVPVTNFISWQDRRSLLIDTGTGENSIDSVKRLCSGEDMKKTGTPFRCGPSVFTLYQMRHAIARHGALRFFTLGDYIGFRLTGGKSGCSITQAAATGLCDIENGCWNDNITSALGLDSIVFPDIIDETTAYGEAEINGIPVRVYPCVGDQQAAILGSFVSDDALAINIGTGAQVCTVCARLQYGNYEVRPFFDGNYLKTVTSLPGGRALNILFDFVKRVLSDAGGDSQISDHALWRRIDHLAENAGDGLALDLSFFQQPGGHIGHIRDGNFDIGSLFKGAYSSMSDAYHASAALLGGGMKRIVCMGGLARKSKPLREAIHERFGLLPRTPPLSEDALWGLAQLSLIASGKCEDFTCAQKLCLDFGKEITT